MNTRLAVFLAATATAFLPVAGAQQPQPGDLWETTTEMQMSGMSLPGHAQQVCSPKNSDEPAGVPQPQGAQCDMYDVHHSGTTTTWKMRCTGQQAMTGSGQITYEGPDRYKGQMVMDTGDGPMTIKMSGRRLGDCDAGKLKRDTEAMVAKTQAESQRMVAQQCGEAARGMQVQMFDGTYPTTCDPKFKADLCKRMSTEEGYDLLAVRDKAPNRADTDLEAAGKLCAVDTNAVHDKLCKAALDKESSLLFLARHCPAEAEPLAKAQCAGRAFTGAAAVPEKYREFCSTYARHGLMNTSGPGGQAAGGGEQAPAPPPPQENAVQKSKKALRKMLPF